MKKLLLYTILYIISIFLLAGIASAANVCINVYYPDEDVFGKCVDIAADSTGYEVMQKAGLSLEWIDRGADLGHYLCKINAVGNAVSGSTCNGTSNWNFLIALNDKWTNVSAGFDKGTSCWSRSESSSAGHYCAKDGDVLGFAYGDADAKPMMIKIKDLKAYVDSDKSSGVDEEGGTIKDVKPESIIKLKMIIENLYTDDVDIEIQEVEVSAVIEGIDDGDDIDEEADSFDIDADSKEPAEIEFELPLELEDGNFDLIINVTGEDEKGIKYSTGLELSLRVKKDKHAVKITQAELRDASLKCARTTSLDIDFVNIGREKEDDVTVDITSAALGVNIRDSGIELDDNPFDSDSTYGESYEIAVADNVAAGSYPITIKVSYSGETTTKTVNLGIEKCAAETTETTTTETATIPATPATTEVTTTTPGTTPETLLAIAQPAKKGIFDNAEFLLIAVIIVDVLLVIGIIVMIVLLVKRR